jgi:hypothetical protein
MPDRSKIRPRDPNQLAYRIIQEATGQVPKYDPRDEATKPVDPSKNPNAVALGRLGGLNGQGRKAQPPETLSDRGEGGQDTMGQAQIGDQN